MFKSRAAKKLERQRKEMEARLAGACAWEEGEPVMGLSKAGLVEWYEEWKRESVEVVTALRDVPAERDGVLSEAAQPSECAAAAAAVMQPPSGLLCTPRIPHANFPHFPGSECRAGSEIYLGAVLAENLRRRCRLHFPDFYSSSGHGRGVRCSSARLSGHGCSRSNAPFRFTKDTRINPRKTLPPDGVEKK